MQRATMGQTRELPQHSAETLQAHYDLLRAWLRTLKGPDCERGESSCFGCPFYTLVEVRDKEGDTIAMPEGTDFTICSLLDDISRIIEGQR